jgi:hypothetical protein
MMPEMGKRVPMYKGIGVFPVVAALSAHARGPQAVPATLRHYLEESVVITEWYPESEFIELCQCLARVLEADGMTDVWSYFGRVAAERDLKGIQDAIPVERRVRLAGAYRRFAADELLSVTSWIQRLPKLWSLYHDSGNMVVGRASGAYSAVLRLCGYPAPLPAHYLHLHAVYFAEYARFMNLNIGVRAAGTTPGLVPVSDWELDFEHTPEILRELSTLSALARPR